MFLSCSQSSSIRSAPKNTGFTLIELLVVIAIIGLLSSVVFASLNSARGKARDAQRMGDMQQITRALWLYFDSNGSMPPTVGSNTCGDRYQNAMQAIVNAGYLPSIPRDPGSGTYCYYNYGGGNNMGAMVRAMLEAADPSLGYPGTCRPFSGSNWCRSDVASRQYCVCNPH